MNEFRYAQYRSCKLHTEGKIEKLKVAASYKSKKDSCSWESADKTLTSNSPWNNPTEIKKLEDKFKLDSEEDDWTHEDNQHGVPRSLMPSDSTCTVDYDKLAALKIKDRQMAEYNRTRLSVEKVFGTWWKEQYKQHLRLCLIDDNDCGRRCTVFKGECKVG